MREPQINNQIFCVAMLSGLDGFVLLLLPFEYRGWQLAGLFCTLPAGVPGHPGSEVALLPPMNASPSDVQNRSFKLGLPYMDGI